LFFFRSQSEKRTTDEMGSTISAVEAPALRPGYYTITLPATNPTGVARVHRPGRNQILT
jgi:hypothetical protein